MPSPDPPEQFVDDQNAWTAADHARRLADPTYKPINPEWQEARDRALVEAGFAADPAPAKPLDHMEVRPTTASKVGRHPARVSCGVL